MGVAILFVLVVRNKRSGWGKDPSFQTLSQALRTTDA